MAIGNVSNSPRPVATANRVMAPAVQPTVAPVKPVKPVEAKNHTALLNMANTAGLTFGGALLGTAGGWFLSGLAGVSEAVGFGILLGTPVVLAMAGLGLGIYLATRKG
ncbi:MAG: hypothetical protein JWM80_6433 [Cyanobacteria bacterium RYN_339]|nr:hypothetical protein [Cyanobacteria bacterium RYN_339]